MARTLPARLSGICFALVLAFGTIAALEQPSPAQITVKCWREYCVKDPQTGKETCAREEIPCPTQT